METALAAAQIHLWPGQRQAQLVSYLFPSYSWEQLAARPAPGSSPRTGNQQVSVDLMGSWMPSPVCITYNQTVSINTLLMYLSDKLESHWKGLSRTSMEDWGQEGCGQNWRVQKRAGDQVSRTQELQGETKPIASAYLKKDWKRTQLKWWNHGKGPHRIKEVIDDCIWFITGQEGMVSNCNMEDSVRPQDEQ